MRLRFRDLDLERDLDLLLFDLLCFFNGGGLEERLRFFISDGDAGDTPRFFLRAETGPGERLFERVTAEFRGGGVRLRLRLKLRLRLRDRIRERLRLGLLDLQRGRERGDGG